MKVKLETISPVHVGSGLQYQGNAEYLYFDQERVIVLPEQDKVLKLIGYDNIGTWINYIEEKENDFLDYLRQRCSNLKPEDLAGRIIPLQGNRAPYFTNTLREQIRGGFGQAYLPGSSIKGAIRTAIFSETLMNRYQEIGISRNQIGQEDRYDRHKFLIKDRSLQQEVFGRDPNADWLRMLQVGDCPIEAETHAAFAETLNELSNERYEVKGDVRQLIEYIPAGTLGEFSINIPEIHLNLIKRKAPELFRAGVRDLNLPRLFQLIHHHTLRLLDNEIRFFVQADLPPGVAAMPDFLADLYKDASGFRENECLLRFGFGTGYRNMTGDWVEDLLSDDDLYDVATATRRTEKYNDFPLPKSRKFLFEGVLPGYVKLSL